MPEPAEDISAVADAISRIVGVPIVGDLRSYLSVCSGGIRSSANLEFDYQVSDLPELNAAFTEDRKGHAEEDAEWPWPASSPSFVVLATRRGEWWFGCIAPERAGHPVPGVGYVPWNEEGRQILPYLTIWSMMASLILGKI